MLLGNGRCREMAPHQAWGGRWGLGFTSSLFVSQITCLCPLPMEAAVWGWLWAKQQSWGREGARRPMGISPAVLSEIAWVNKHESRWETRRSGWGQHSLSSPCERFGEEREREEPLGLFSTRRTWLDGAVSGLGLSCHHPEPQLSPCPRSGVGDRAGMDSMATGRMGSTARGAVGCGPFLLLPLVL